MCIFERVCGGPFIAWRGRFPGEIRAGTLVTDVGMAVATFLPKLRGPGTHPGSADPWVGPLSTVFTWEFGRWVDSVCFLFLYVSLVCLVGPLSMCDT